LRVWEIFPVLLVEVVLHPSALSSRHSEHRSAADFNKVCDNCGSRHWQFFPDLKTRQRWITWLTTPDPAKDKMGKVVHLKTKPDQPA
jgi:hypothetical protein